MLKFDESDYAAADTSVVQNNGKGRGHDGACQAVDAGFPSQTPSTPLFPEARNLIGIETSYF